MSKRLRDWPGIEMTQPHLYPPPVHQRGRGQVMPLCRGGEAPIGWVVPWADVTCPACAPPIGDRLTAAFGALWDAVVSAVTPVIDAYCDGLHSLASAISANARSNPDDFTLAGDGEFNTGKEPG